MSSPEQELVSRYLLARLLEESRRATMVGERRADQDPPPSIVYPQLSSQSLTRPLRKLLERAKQSIDVIDFRSSQAQVSQFCLGKELSSRRAEIQILLMSTRVDPFKTLRKASYAPSFGCYEL